MAENLKINYSTAKTIYRNEKLNINKTCLTDLFCESENDCEKIVEEETPKTLP